MIGILCATRREAAPLITALKAEPVAQARPRAWSFSLTGQRTGILVVSGMGPRRATAAAEQLATVYGATHVLNVGICGALRDDIPVGSLYRIHQATQAASPDHSWTAEQEPSVRPWRDLPSLRLATSPKPVFSQAKRNQLSTMGDLVDMEGAAVVEVATRHGLPWVLLKGVSDQANAQGPLVLLQHIDDLSARLAHLVHTGLTTGTGEVTPPRAVSGKRLSVRKFLRFTKIEHTVFSLPLLFAGAWLAAGQHWPPWTTLGLIAQAGVGARILGMAMNRYLDRHLDALNPRTANRELPSGQLSPRTALGVAAAGLALYLSACALLGPLPLLLSPIPAAVLAGYSLLKRFTPYCHFGIGASLALAPAGAHVAVAGNLQPGAPLVLLALFTFFWISAFDIIYALQDIEADRRNGVHSLPAALGSRKAQIFAALVHLAALASAAGMAWSTGGGTAWVAWGLLGGTLAAAYWPAIPLPQRFFPLSALAALAGALVPLLGNG